jgi:predicted RNase H-like nuclease (RuvC/YqgF family)
MKKIFYSLAVTMLLTAGTVITSCNSPSNKANKSKENVEEAQRDLEETKADAELQRQKAATVEEWEDFKSESEIKIKENETRIEELKEKMMKPGDGIDSLRQKRINTLEEKNNKLKAMINTYESNQSDWESFKREFNHDMDELGKAFKDLTIDNKK